GRRPRLAERGASRPVVGRQAVAQAQTPVALEDDALDVVTRGVGKRRPALQQVRPEALHGQSGRAQRREGALAALLEGELAAFVAAPLHLGLAQATLEGGLAGQESSMQELGLLHDDPATGPNDARKLGKRPARLLDAVENVAAPDPAERRVGHVELGGLSLAELEARGEWPAADQRARRFHALRGWLDAYHAPSWPDRLG